LRHPVTGRIADDDRSPTPSYPLRRTGRGSSWFSEYSVLNPSICLPHTKHGEVGEAAGLAMMGEYNGEQAGPGREELDPGAMSIGVKALK
jgi:hypothetical protein